MEKPFFLRLAVMICVMKSTGTLSAFPPDFGDVTASSNYVYVGGNLSIACTVKKSLDVVGKNLSLWFEDTPVGGVTSDPWTVQLTLGKVTLDDSGLYECYLDDDLIGSAEISVEFPVRAAENVSCVVYNWASMQCSWSLVDYQHPENIQVYLQWICLKCSGGVSNCPDLTQTSCRWPEFYGSPQYVMNITVENTVTKDAKSTVQRIFTYDFVKPDPVAKLRVVDRNHSCVQLQWSHEEEERISDMVFRVSQTELPGDPSKVVAPRIKGDNLTVCDLHPATNYSFAVECFPNEADKGFWSDAANVTATTLEDVPAEGPPITAGSFVSDATQCNEKGTRLVTLFWQSVPKASRNGEVRNYTLQYGDSAVEVSGDQYSKQLELDCQQLYRVDLFASTAVGKSLNHTTLEIPPEPAGPASSPVLEFLVDITNSRVQAQWRVAGEEGNATVFWCQGEVDLCQGEMQWSTVQASSGSLPLPVQTRQASQFLYGISTGPLGITWATCLADKLAKPVKPVEGLSMTPGSGQGVLKAMWLNMKCSYSNPIVITEYLLRVCQRPCPQNSIRVISIPGNQSQYELEGLSPGAEYQVNIQAVALGGEGPLSDPSIEKVPERSSVLSAGQMAGLIVGLAALVALVVTLVVCCTRYKREKMDVRHPEIKIDDSDHPTENTYHLVMDEEVPYADQPPQSKVDHTSSHQNGGPGWLSPVEFVGTHRQLNHRPEGYMAHHMVPNGKPFGSPGEMGVHAERGYVGREDLNQEREAPFPGAAVTSGIGGGMDMPDYVQNVNEVAPPRPSLRAAAADFVHAETEDDTDAAGREAAEDVEQGEDYVTAGEERDSGPNLQESAVDPEPAPGEEPVTAAMETVEAASSSVLPAAQGWAAISTMRGRAGEGDRGPQASEATAQRPASSPSPPPYVQAVSPEREPMPAYVQAVSPEGEPMPAYVQVVSPEGEPMPAYVQAAALDAEDSRADEQSGEGQIDDDQPASYISAYGGAAPQHNGIQLSLGQGFPPYLQAGTRSIGEESDEGESLSSSQPSYIQAGNPDFSGSHNHDDTPSTSTSASSLPYKKMEDIKMLETGVQPARCEDEVAMIPVNEADLAGIVLMPIQESPAPLSPSPERNAENSEQAPMLRLSGSIDAQKDTSPSLPDRPQEIADSLREEDSGIGSAVQTGYCRADQLLECTRL